MIQDTPAQNIGQDVMARLNQLRTQMYGQRGLGEFARELGVSPASYRRYENIKAAPVELLAKAAKLTGTELGWLITGCKNDGSSQQEISADRQALLEQIDRLARRNPATLRAIQKFMDLLEQQAERDGTRSPDPDERNGWLPVLGRSAAGVVFFWEDLPVGAVEKPAARVSALIEAYLQAQTTGHWPASIEATDEEASDIVSLIQVNVPSDAAVAEFLDCPAVRKRYPDAFALRIDGESMQPQLLHGDLVIVSPSQPALQGKPAVVQLRDQIGVTCKLYRQEADKVHLIPTNKQYEPQSFELTEVQWALRVLFRVRVSQTLNR